MPYSRKTHDRSLTARAAERITQLVIDEAIPAGTRLPNEYDLAELLGVGRSTVREAIRSLVSQNVLEVRHGSGTYVCRNVGEVRDPLGFRFCRDRRRLALALCQLRTIIEPELAAMAAKHARREAVTELQGFCDEVEELHNAGQDHTASDFRLHVGIAAASGNTVAPKLISILSTSITIVTEVTERRIMRETIEFHQQAVTAIRKRQPRRARQALLDHMRFNIDTILALPDRTIAGPLPAAGGGA